MRRAGRLFLAAALLPAAAPPPPLDARNDAREVLRTVVRAETASPVRDGVSTPLCVQQRLNGASVGGGGFRRDDFLLLNWHPVVGRGIAHGQTMREGDREAIREAMRAALSASTQRRWLSRVEPEWISGPLGFCTNDADRRLVFSSAVIVGDVAFVAIGLECRNYCGYGWGDSVALRRTARGWTVIGWRRVFSN